VSQQRGDIGGTKHSTQDMREIIYNYQEYPIPEFKDNTNCKRGYMLNKTLINTKGMNMAEYGNIHRNVQ
jgi:hypothetical protein